MKIKTTYILLILILFISISYSQDSNFSGKNTDKLGNYDKIDEKNFDKSNPIESFRAKQFKEVDNIYSENKKHKNLDIKYARDKLETISNDFRTIVSQFRYIKQRKEEITKRHTQLKKTIYKVVTNVRDTRQNIKNKLDKISEYEEKLDSLKKRIESISSDLEFTKNLVNQYVKALYKINNNFYGDDLKLDNIKLLVNSKNIANSISSENIVKSLSSKTYILFDKLKTKYKKYKKFSKKFSNAKEDYKKKIKSYKKDLKHFRQQREYLTKFMEYYKNDKSKINDRYEKLFDAKKQYKNQLVKIKNNLSKNKFKKHASAQSKKNLNYNLSGNKNSDRFFGPPVLPIKDISVFFKDSKYRIKYGTNHNAIDIPKAQGSEIYAPAKGVVEKVKDTDGPDLNWILISHKYGYVTAYLHISKATVKEGDIVERGEIIGLVGGKPGTRGAGLKSSGSHLHFEVIKNGNYVNPLDYMDLSVIKNKDILPKKYRIKYVKDKLKRNIDLREVDYVSGDTVKERRKNFLSKYGTGPFSRLSLWRRGKRGTNVDIDLGICIGFAETGLGANMVSAWNVGNVGNNDRGNRVDFDSSKQGVRSIYIALTNEYLNDHYTINKLSRYDNENGSIYASSDKHWQKNVQKCLTSIKGYRVPKAFPFREYSGNKEIVFKKY